MRPYQTSLVTAAAQNKGQLDTAESEALGVT
jgi:hypothetical protein